MQAKIFSHSQLIGTANLTVGDATMGCLFGDFLPTKEYYKNIQKSVWEFWQTTKVDFKKWNSFRLNAQLENGIFLFPVGGYTIDDIEELPNEPKRIGIMGIDSEIIDDLYSGSSKIFFEEPWNTLKINQKIAFEDELKKEIGSNKKSFWELFSIAPNNLLSGVDFSAFCHDQRNDDVLFEIRKPALEKRFALVHLTWTSKKEKVRYPKTTFYSSFDEFKYSKMNEDKSNWEK